MSEGPPPKSKAVGFIDKSAMLKATGKTPEQWFAIIEKSGKSERPHSEIACYLYEEQNISYWWAQQITVDYEKFIGRRMTGQTEDGRFQIGVNKTVSASKDALWDYLCSEDGLSLLCNEGAEAEITTSKSNSHFRMRWRMPAWSSHSILQVRVTDKGKGKTTLSFHQEKLPDAKARESMRERWRTTSERIAQEFTVTP